MAVATNPSMKSNNTFVILLEDILNTHILPKLPLITLFRFKCVNKQWKSIISHPNFKVSLEHQTHLLAISYKDQIYKMLSSNNDIISNPLRLGNILEQLPPHAPSPQYDQILGSCNGLVLFHKGVDIFLWNLHTSYCRKVIELENLADTVRSVIVSSGFCYDTSSDDYIVILAFRRLHEQINPVISASLKTKTWRRVVFPYNIGGCSSDTNRSFYDDPIIVNNILHWLASDLPTTSNNREPRYEPLYKIIYFDAPSNTLNYELIPCPEGQGKLGRLGVFVELLCLTRIINKGDVEVLVMKEYGVKESWTTMFCIQDAIPSVDYFSSVQLVLCSLKSDVLLFRINKVFHAYYPSTRIMEKLEVPYPYDWFMLPCVVSLVSPASDEYNWNEEYHKKIASATARQALGF